MTCANGVRCFTRNTPGLEFPAERNSAKSFGMVRKSWVTRMRPCAAAIANTSGHSRHAVSRHEPRRSQSPVRVVRSRRRSRDRGLASARKRTMRYRRTGAATESWRSRLARRKRRATSDNKRVILNALSLRTLTDVRSVLLQSPGVHGLREAARVAAPPGREPQPRWRHGRGGELPSKKLTTHAEISQCTGRR
jgi:hypothetical protein